MMSRTQVTLGADLQRKAKKRANEMGVSLAEYIRGVLARDLERPTSRVDPSIIFNLGSSGGSDIARNKDEMIADAIGSRKLRRS